MNAHCKYSIKHDLCSRWTDKLAKVSTYWVRVKGLQTISEPPVMLNLWKTELYSGI